MSPVLEQPEIRTDVIEQMRDMADRGANVRTLVEMVKRELDLKGEPLLTILWYFMKAFCLSLAEVLPLREWLGTDGDEEIDAVILPAIKNSKKKWSNLTNGQVAH